MPSTLTQNECTFYFRDGTETFPKEPCTSDVCYGTRGCQVGNIKRYEYPGYLHVGNSQAARYFVRFAEFFNQDVTEFGKDLGKNGIKAMYGFVV